MGIPPDVDIAEDAVNLGIEVAGPVPDSSDGLCSDPRSSLTGLSFRELVTFEGSEELLRGVRLSKIMGGCGRIFRNSRGSPSAYQLSESIDSISYFISHNWAVPGTAKQVALAFKFNLHLAILAGSFTLVLGFALGISGFLPTMEVSGSEYQMGYVIRMCNIPVILVALFFGSDLLCWKTPLADDPVMFLDKACIHQEDKQLQKAGIRKLGAFLRSSERMLVLVTPLYLKKLWTVYEVASFFSVHDVSHLEVVPIMLPIAFVIFLTLMCGHQLCMAMVHAWGVPAWLQYLVNALGGLAYLVCLRVWARSKVDIQRSIASFSVRETECEVESDREVVYENIVALQKACGRVPRTASMEEALEAFDEQVRRVLSVYFEKVFGRLSFTQSEYFLIGLVVAGSIQDQWAKVGDGQPFREALGERCMDCFFVHFAVPVWLLTLEAVAGCYLSPAWLSWKDIAFTLIANAFASCIGLVSVLLHYWWGNRARFDDKWLIGAVVVSVLLISLRVYVIGRYGSLHRAGWKSKEGVAPLLPLLSGPAPSPLPSPWSSSTPLEAARAATAAATATPATAAAPGVAVAPRAIGAAVFVGPPPCADGAFFLAADNDCDADPKFASYSLPTTSVGDIGTDDAPTKPERARGRILASL